MFRQARGLKHCKNIKRKAMRLWKQSNYQKGLWDTCLKECIKRHRKKVEQENKKRLEELEIRRQEELNFYNVNGWIDGCC